MDCVEPVSQKESTCIFIFLHFPKHPNYDFPLNAMAVFFYLFWQLCNSFPVGFPLHARSLGLFCVCTLNLIQTTIKQKVVVVLIYVCI